MGGIDTLIAHFTQASGLYSAGTIYSVQSGCDWFTGSMGLGLESKTQLS